MQHRMTNSHTCSLCIREQGTLWSREAEKRRELASVRQAREQLQAQQRSEAEGLSVLDAALRQKVSCLWRLRWTRKTAVAVSSV